MTNQQQGSGGSQDKSEDDLKKANETIVQLRGDLRKAKEDNDALNKANEKLVKDAEVEEYEPPETDKIDGSRLYEIVSAETVGDSFVVRVKHADDGGREHEFSWASDSDREGYKDQLAFWAKRIRIENIEGRSSAIENTAVPVASPSVAG